MSVDGLDYTVVVDEEGLRLTAKGKRRPEVELRWHDLLSGQAAMAMALNASLSTSPKPAEKTTSEQATTPTRKQVSKQSSR